MFSMFVINAVRSRSQCEVDPGTISAGWAQRNILSQSLPSERIGKDQYKHTRAKAQHRSKAKNKEKRPLSP